MEERRMGTALKGTESPVLIKKYGNRRLYDTTQSRYITLDDLAAIVRSGAMIKVVEASTERDLTRQVLTQVILEQQEALDMFPIELLQAIIRVQGTLEQAPFSAFLSVATRQFIQHGNLWTQQMSAFFGAFNNPSAAADEVMPRTGAEPRRTAPLSKDASQAATTAGEAGPQSTQEATDLNDLRQRMDNLLGKLGRS
jgi:polyhydroxyalkanoate synthesis repressor PhaR